MFEQTAYSRSLEGKKLISSTWCQLGLYDQMLAFYDELQQKWGTDTLHSDYAVMLRNRATATRARGNFRASDAYMQRYSNLIKVLTDAERLATAQEYAARYHEQEQQLALEHEQASKNRMGMIALFLGILTLVAIVSFVIILRQLLAIRKKDTVLQNEIKEHIDYKEKYLSMVGKMDVDKMNVDKKDVDRMNVDKLKSPATTNQQINPSTHQQINPSTYRHWIRSATRNCSNTSGIWCRRSSCTSTRSSGVSS